MRKFVLYLMMLSVTLPVSHVAQAGEAYEARKLELRRAFEQRRAAIRRNLKQSEPRTAYVQRYETLAGNLRATMPEPVTPPSPAIAAVPVASSPQTPPAFVAPALTKPTPPVAARPATPPAIPVVASMAVPRSPAVPLIRVAQAILPLGALSVPVAPRPAPPGINPLQTHNPASPAPESSAPARSNVPAPMAMASGSAYTMASLAPAAGAAAAYRQAAPATISRVPPSMIRPAPAPQAVIPAMPLPRSVPRAPTGPRMEAPDTPTYTPPAGGFAASSGNSLHVWPPPRPIPPEFAIFKLTAGWRQDDFDWNVAADASGTATPNILSELIWRDVTMYEAKAESEVTLPDGWLRGTHFEGLVSLAGIFDGEVQDSDFAGNNRTLEFSRSVGDADEGNAQAYSLAVGYKFEAERFLDTGWRDTSLFMTPVVGYAYRSTDFSFGDSNLVVSRDFGENFSGGPLGPITGLDSSYDAEWKGPFIGLGLGGVYGTHRIGLKGQYHFADYEAEANWNLRDDFAHPRSFIQGADADGIVLSADYGYEFSENLLLNLQASYQDWTTDNGYDVIFFSDGTASNGRLNEANLQSQAYHVGLAYVW